MGRSSDWAIEIAEQQYEERRAEWIRRELNSDDADEFTERWDELAQEYDAHYDGYEEYIEEEYRWLHEQEYSGPYASFHNTIQEIEKILSSHIDPIVADTMHKMAHVHAVTALETYLGDTLKQLMIGQEQYFLNAAQNIKDINERRLKPYEVLANKDFVEQMVFKHISDHLYHDPVKAMRLYKDCLDFKCTHSLGTIIKAATLRHDIVHRNGKDKDGSNVIPNFTEVKSAISEIKDFVHYLDKALALYRPQ